MRRKKNPNVHRKCVRGMRRHFRLCAGFSQTAHITPNQFKSSCERMRACAPCTMTSEIAVTRALERPKLAHVQAGALRCVCVCVSVSVLFAHSERAKQTCVLSHHSRTHALASACIAQFYLTLKVCACVRELAHSSELSARVRAILCAYILLVLYTGIIRNSRRYL